MKTFGVLLLVASIAGAQLSWVQRLPTFSPPARYHHSMAYDSARGRTLLFGGDGASPNTNDTWEWDGTEWARRLPILSPTGRGSHAMAYDSARGRMLLFGGYGAPGLLNDTWEWDGTTWVLRTPSTTPLARVYHAMAYDSARGKTVLFGGNAVTPLSDTWEWDGTAWTQRIVATFPSGRWGHAMIYDSARGKTVLFGGYTSNNSSDETWEWDGSTWTQRLPAAAPPARYLHALAYDSGRGRTVLFGGSSSDTWEWDGTLWTQTLGQGCGMEPSPRRSHALTYHAARQQILLFGGDGALTFADTWEYGPPTPPHPCSIIGRGYCIGGSLFVTCATRPTIGTVFRLTFNNPGNVAGFNLLYLGARLDPPIPIVSPVICGPIGFLYPIPWIVLQAIGNPAIFPIFIPNETALVGQAVVVQGGSYEVSGCFRLSDAVLVTIQAP